MWTLHVTVEIMIQLNRQLKIQCRVTTKVNWEISTSQKQQLPQIRVLVNELVTGECLGCPLHDWFIVIWTKSFVTLTLIKEFACTVLYRYSLLQQILYYRYTLSHACTCIFFRLKDQWNLTLPLMRSEIQKSWGRPWKDWVTTINLHSIP